MRNKKKNMKLKNNSHFLYILMFLLYILAILFLSFNPVNAENEINQTNETNQTNENLTNIQIYVTASYPVEQWISSIADFNYDVDGNVQVDNCSLITDENLIATDYSIELNSQNTFSQQSLAESTNHWKVQCSYQYISDNLTQNYISESNSAAVYVDTNKPQINLISPLNNSIILPGDEIKFNYVVTDDKSSTLSCRMFVDAALKQDDFEIQNNSEALYLTDLDIGKHSCDIICSDLAENKNSVYSEFEVIDLNISTNKAVYNIGEDVYIAVNAPQNSSLSMVIYWNNGNNQLIPTNLNRSFPLTYKFQDADKVDKYLVNASISYKGSIISKLVNFSVSNNIVLSIYSASSSNVNAALNFSAIALYGIEPYTYKWNFGDGTTSSNQNITHIYSTPGNYVVVLTVKDSMNNEKNISKTVSITQSYSFKLSVKENTTDNSIEDAKVVLGDLILYTNSSGRIEANVLKGTYILYITRSGYSSYSKEYNLSENKDITIYMDQLDSFAPRIQLFTPPNGSLEINPMIFTFKAFDNGSMTCALYYNAYSESDWWEVTEKINISSGQEGSFSIEEMSPADYKWKIECTDRLGNSNFSNIYYFTLENTQELAEPLSLNSQDISQEETGDLYGSIALIDEILFNFEKYSNEEKSLVDVLNLKSKLNELRKEFEKANRDLYNLDKKGLSDQELFDERDNILKNMDLLKQQIPQSVEILQSNEFIKYPTLDDIKEVASIYLGLYENNPSSKKIDSFSKQLKEMQSFISVSTRSTIVKVAYASGQENDYTIIDRTLDINQSYNNISILEYLPKEIIDSTDKIFFLDEVEILKKDPFAKISSNDKKITYIINGSVPIEKIPKIKSIVLIGDFTSKSQSLISGFLIFDKYNFGVNMRLFFIELIAIIILGSVYMTYTLKSRKSKKSSLAKEMKDNQYIHTLIDDALESLKSGDLEKTSIIYTEIELIYNTLNQEKKDEVYPKITDLASEINLFYLKKMIADVSEAISENRISQANEGYNDIQAIYKLLDDKYKDMVKDKCIELHDAINSKLLAVHRNGA
jgi:PKD repeat protein